VIKGAVDLYSTDNQHYYELKNTTSSAVNSHVSMALAPRLSTHVGQNLALEPAASTLVSGNLEKDQPGCFDKNSAVNTYSFDSVITYYGVEEVAVRRFPFGY
jgi:hypothetical protein